MADSLVEIALQFKVGDLSAQMEEFKKATESTAISPKIKADITLIVEQFKTIIEEAQKQMAAGTLDPSSLGLSKLVGNIETLYRNLAKQAGISISDEMKRLQQEAVTISDKINTQATKIKDAADAQKGLTPEKLKAEAKATTGFTGQAIGAGSIKEATSQLNKYLELEKAGSKQKGLPKKIAFYKELISLYKKAEKTIASSNKKEANAKELLAKYEKDLLANKKAQAKEAKKYSGVETKEMKQLAKIISKVTGVKMNALQITKMLTGETKRQTKASRDASKANTEEGKGLTQKAAAAFSYYLVFNQLKRVFNDTLRTIKQLDKAMTDASIVTSMNRKEAWALLGSYQQLAKNTGLATSEIATTVTQFLRQGRSVKDAMILTEIAAKSAKVAGISADEAVNYLTSAVNGFGLAAKQSEMIADKFASIAAQSATSFEELAIAMSKVSPTARSVGVSVDFMMGVIAKGIETTREAPENIGTAFKTIFARMREITDIGKAMDDGMDANRVEKALASVDVQLRDATGQFRNLETVLMEVGEKWETLTSVEQAYLATTLAGSRQQPRLLAIFNDFARTKELIEISSQSTGELANQHVQYMMGSEAALNNLTTAWQAFTMSFVDLEIIIDVVHMFTGALETVTRVIQSKGDASDWMKTILLGLAAAYIMLTSKKLVDLAITKLATIATHKSNAALFAKKKITILTATQLKKLTLQQKLKYISDLAGTISAKGMAGAFLAQAGAAVKAGLAMGFLLIKLLPLVAIGVLVAKVIGNINEGINDSGKNASFFAKQVAETNSQLSKLNSKDREVKKIADRFDLLAKKTAKSVEELNEMNDLAKELQSVEIDERKFDLTRKDEITGRIILDTKAVEEYENYINERRDSLLQRNMATFRAAIAKDLEGVLDNATLMNIFQEMGLKFGEAFIEGLKTAEGGLSVEVEENLTDALANLSEVLTPDLLTAPMTGLRFDTSNMNDNIKELFKDKIFATRVEAEKFVQDALDAGEINQSEYDTIMGRGNASGAGEGLLIGGGVGTVVGGIIGGIIGSFGGPVGTAAGAAIGAAIGAGTGALIGADFGDKLNEIEYTGIDEARMEHVVDNVMSAFTVGFKKLDETLFDINNNLDLSPLEKTEAILSATAQGYVDTVAEIDRKVEQGILSASEREVAIKAVGATMQDAAILNDLINNKNISVSVIAKMTVDLNIEDIEKIFNEMQKELDESDLSYEIKTYSCGVEQTFSVTDTERKESLMKQYESVLGDLFSNTADGVEAGFIKLKAYVDSLVAAGVLTAEEGARLVVSLANKIKTLSLDDAAKMLKDQLDLVKEISGLANKISTGDFSTFAKLVETFGLDIAKGVLSKDTEALETFFEAQNSLIRDQIRESIKKIEGAAFALNRLPNAIEEQQILGLEYLIVLYDTISVHEQLRNFRLAEAEQILKRMNDTLSLQEKFSALGLTGGVFDMFTEMADQYYNEGLGWLITQVEDDLALLNDQFNEDGFFMDPENLGLGQAAIDNAMNSLTRLIDGVTAAYNRQKKEIEERYKTEISAIKDGNSERWSQIDYTNKLGEAEEKIIDARRKLMGLAISGVSRGTLEQSQKELKKLQEERQKMIEQKMVDEATKQMEIDMDKELIKTQQQLTSVLDSLIEEMNLLRNVFLRNEAPIVDPGDGPFVEDKKQTFVFEPPAQAALDNVTISNNEVVKTNIRLIDSIDHLASVMGRPTPQPTPTTGGGGGNSSGVPTPRSGGAGSGGLVIVEEFY
jgi:TP901 family phage tail tape measure protein